MESIWTSTSASIVVDKVVGYCVDQLKMLQLLRDHICKNTVRINGQSYTQSKGIPQGSILSPILCSLFYGDFDREHLSDFMSDPESLLVRFIDDMLFVSTSYSTATQFLELMLPGFAEYGIEICLHKVATNFYHPLVCQKLDSTKAFPWCGLLIDTDTLEVAADHTRSYGTCTGCHFFVVLLIIIDLANTLTISRANRLVEAFLRQIKMYPVRFQLFADV